MRNAFMCSKEILKMKPITEQRETLNDLVGANDENENNPMIALLY